MYSSNISCRLSAYCILHIVLNEQKHMCVFKFIYLFFLSDSENCIYICDWKLCNRLMHNNKNTKYKKKSANLKAKLSQDGISGNETLPSYCTWHSVMLLFWYSTHIVYMHRTHYRWSTNFTE